MTKLSMFVRSSSSVSSCGLWTPQQQRSYGWWMNASRRRSKNNSNNVYDNIRRMVSSDSKTEQPIRQSTTTLPETTWSIASLELQKNHPPIQYDELILLAKRAVIDIDIVAETAATTRRNNSTNKRTIMTDQPEIEEDEQEDDVQDKQMHHQQPDVDPTISVLCQDLGNMIHMIHQVTYELPPELKVSMELLTAEELYDIPRGVTSAPIRYNDNNEAENDSDDKWKNYIQPKMIPKGGHNYFVIATSKQTKENNPPAATTTSSKKIM